jgi:hypothetical protein
MVLYLNIFKSIKGINCVEGRFLQSSLGETCNIMLTWHRSPNIIII